MEDLVLSCLESRVEDNRNLYARFLVGPFLKGDALTVATALRRVLLSSVESIGITAVYIQGITHEFSTIVGVRESVLELSLNFGAIVLSYDKTFFQKKSFFDKLQIGYLQVQGPKVIYANHLKLPLGVKLVDPTQYIATISKEGSIILKFIVGKRNKRLHQNIGPELDFGNQLKKLPIVEEIGKKNIAKAKKACSYKNGFTISSFFGNGSSFPFAPLKLPVRLFSGADLEAESEATKPLLSDKYKASESLSAELTQKLTNCKKICSRESLVKQSSLGLTGQSYHQRCKGRRQLQKRTRRQLSCLRSCQTKLRFVRSCLRLKRFAKQNPNKSSIASRYPLLRKNNYKASLARYTAKTELCKPFTALNFYSAKVRAGGLPMEPFTNIKVRKQKRGYTRGFDQSFFRGGACNIKRFVLELFCTYEDLQSKLFHWTYANKHTQSYVLSAKLCKKFYKKSRNQPSFFCRFFRSKTKEKNNCMRNFSSFLVNSASKSFSASEAASEVWSPSKAASYKAKLCLAASEAAKLSDKASLCKTKKLPMPTTEKASLCKKPPLASTSTKLRFVRRFANPCFRYYKSSYKAKLCTCQKVWSSRADFCSAKVRPTTKGAKGIEIDKLSASYKSYGYKSEIYQNNSRFVSIRFIKQVKQTFSIFCRKKSLKIEQNGGLQLFSQNGALYSMLYKQNLQLYSTCFLGEKNGIPSALHSFLLQTKEAFAMQKLGTPTKVLERKVYKKPSKLCFLTSTSTKLLTKQGRPSFVSRKKNLCNNLPFLEDGLKKKVDRKQKALKFLRNKDIFKSNICLRNVIPLDLTLTPVLKVNFVVEIDDEVLYLRQKVRERIILEVWTNGSIHPRQAVHDSSLRLLDMFASFRSVYGDPST